MCQVCEDPCITPPPHTLTQKMVGVDEMLMKKEGVEECEKKRRVLLQVMALLSAHGFNNDG